MPKPPAIDPELRLIDITVEQLAELIDSRLEAFLDGIPKPVDDGYLDRAGAAKFLDLSTAQIDKLAREQGPAISPGWGRQALRPRRDPSVGESTTEVTAGKSRQLTEHDNSAVQALLWEAEAHELLAKAARFRATIAAAEQRSEHELLDGTQTLAEFGVGRDGLKNAAARGENALTRGARGRLLVSRAASSLVPTPSPVRSRSGERVTGADQHRVDFHRAHSSSASTITKSARKKSSFSSVDSSANLTIAHNNRSRYFFA